MWSTSCVLKECGVVYQLCVNGVWCGLPVVCMECGVVHLLCVSGVWCGLSVSGRRRWSHSVEQMNLENFIVN